MTAGSTYAAVKAALLAKIQARSALENTTVIGEPPVDALRISGPGGGWEAIWLVDADGDADNVVMCGPDLMIDELYGLNLVIQSLPRHRDDLATTETQAITDARVDAMLGEIWLAITADPTLGLVPTFDQVIVSTGSFRRYVGPITDRNLRASRCDLTLNVQARIHFVNP